MLIEKKYFEKEISLHTYVTIQNPYGTCLSVMMNARVLTTMIMLTV